jgi:hypothetical protein
MVARSLRWAAVFALLIALAIPWFLWGVDRLVAGLPVWLWWHVGWLGLSALVFRRFANRAWGLWVTNGAVGGDPE